MIRVVCFLLVVLLISCQRRHPYPRLIADEKATDIIFLNTRRMVNSNRDLFHANERFEDSAGVKSIVIPFDSIPSQPQLEIIIDTSYIFPANGFLYNRVDFPLTGKEPPMRNVELENYPPVKYWTKMMDSLPKRFVKCYPVLIKNLSSQNACITDCRMIQEAMDFDGKWKPIEFHNRMPTDVHDGTKEATLVKSGHAMANPAIKYGGSFRTKLRIKCRINGEYLFYSKPIIGNINRAQFNFDFLKTYVKFNPNFTNGYESEFPDYVFLRRY